MSPFAAFPLTLSITLSLLFLTFSTIPKDKAIEYTKEYLADNYDNDCYLSEYIDEIYSESPELKEKIRSKHLLHPGDIEGKGEWENDYVKVTTLDGEVLFEDGIY